LIETRALCRDLPGGPRLVFSDVHVPQGGRLLVLGPSGAGKSTWLSLAGGLLAPTSGEITVAGQALQGMAAGQRDAWRGRQVGFLPQRLHLVEAFTVRENLALAYFALRRPVDPLAIEAAWAPTRADLWWTGAACGAGARRVDGAAGGVGRRTHSQPGRSGGGHSLGPARVDGSAMWRNARHRHP
jgi:energy-coupling factor transporter ATP-binding protein EcfA2